VSSPFRRWPVRWRIAGISAGLTLLILLCFALIVGRLATDKLKGDFEDELQRSADRLAVQAQLGNVEDFRDAVMAGDGVVKIVDSSGVAAPRTPQAPELGPPEPGTTTRVAGYEVAAQQVFSSSLTQPATFVQYARTRESLDATIDRLWLLLAAGVIGGALLAALAGLAVANRAMRPISSLTVAAREIATTRDPSRRLPMPATDDEVAELAQTLDHMLRELDAARSETQQMIQVQRDFIADASHELRTPLTSILANLELLEARLEGRPSDPEEAEIVAGALGSSRRMRRLVADLLLLARADAGRSGPSRDCDLAAIAAEVLAEVRPVAAGHELVLTGDGPVPVLGDPDDLHRLVLNLLENAVRHTPAGAVVTLTVADADDQAVLEVCDDGAGIPEDIGDQIFSRFVRGGGPADVAIDSGTGLGLAIVKAVATSHGGRVVAGRSPAGGARFTVTLPLGKRALATDPTPTPR
jgi:two-component system OmpR family sensor kinase